MKGFNKDLKRDIKEYLTFDYHLHGRNKRGKERLLEGRRRQKHQKCRANNKDHQFLPHVSGLTLIRVGGKSFPSKTRKVDAYFHMFVTDNLLFILLDQ